MVCMVRSSVMPPVLKQHQIPTFLGGETSRICSDVSGVDTQLILR